MPIGEKDRARPVLQQLRLRFYECLAKSERSEQLVPSICTDVEIKYVRDQEARRCRCKHSEELGVVVAREKYAQNDDETPGEIPPKEQDTLQDGTEKNCE